LELVGQSAEAEDAANGRDVGPDSLPDSLLLCLRLPPKLLSDGAAEVCTPMDKVALGVGVDSGDDVLSSAAVAEANSRVEFVPEDDSLCKLAQVDVESPPPPELERSAIRLREARGDAKSLEESLSLVAVSLRSEGELNKVALRPHTAPLAPLAPAFAPFTSGGLALGARCDELLQLVLPLSVMLICRSAFGELCNAAAGSIVRNGGGQRGESNSEPGALTLQLAR
jgi:hypothetical protein